MSAAIIVILVAGLNMAERLPPDPDLVPAVRAVSERLGINPSDLLTTISFETGGTFDPWKKGPTTQHGTHRGLIQFGEPQAKQYGVREGMPVAEQMDAVGRYLQDRGVKPGHGLLDIYSAVNAGRVGLYNRSDANNGGAPGTVADKVANQMFLHRQRANALLGIGGEAAPGAAPAPVAVAAAGGAPMSLAPAGEAAADAADPLMAALAGIPQMAQQEQQMRPMPQVKINYPVPVGIAHARALARAAARGAV